VLQRDHDVGLVKDGRRTSAYVPSMHTAAAVLLSCQLAGSWNGSTPSGWRLAADVSLNGTEASAAVDMPDVGGFGRRFTGTIVDGCTLELQRPQGAGRPPVWLHLEARGETLTGSLELFGSKAPVTLRRSTASMPRHREQNVTFANGDVRLAGTIILPEKAGRYPAAVFAHGGGPETRNTGQSLAIYLARHGIASLVYDKRGTGESSGVWEIASMEDLARDAVAGAAALRGHAEITAERVGVYGYSQGGWIAPLAATLDPRLAFVAAGGLSGVNPMEQTIHHRTHVMRQEHFDTATIRKAMGLWRQLYASRTREERVATLEQIRAVRNEPWFAAAALPVDIELDPAPSMIEFLRFEPVPVWARVRQPVYVFWGAEDIHVPVRESMRIVAAAAGTDDLTMRVYPGLAHDLRLPPAEVPRVSTAALYEDVTAWLQRFAGS
jgi:dienelactone hydrolase